MEINIGTKHMTLIILNKIIYKLKTISLKYFYQKPYMLMLKKTVYGSKRVHLLFLHRKNQNHFALLVDNRKFIKNSFEKLEDNP